MDILDLKLKKNKNYMLKICKNCKHRFISMNNIRGSRKLPNLIRGYKMITCSRKCSKQYQYIRRKYKCNNRTLKNGKK